VKGYEMLKEIAIGIIMTIPGPINTAIKEFLAPSPLIRQDSREYYTTFPVVKPIIRHTRKGSQRIEEGYKNDSDEDINDTSTVDTRTTVVTTQRRRSINTPEKGLDRSGGKQDLTAADNKHKGGNHTFDTSNSWLTWCCLGCRKDSPVRKSDR
jgi:hypothetical protein